MTAFSCNVAIAPTSAKKEHITYMKPLYKLSNLFGLYEQPGIKPRFFKAYSYLVVIILITTTSISIRNKMHGATTNVRKYIDVTTHLWRSVMNILLVFSLQDSNKLITNFTQIIAEVDNMLDRYYVLNYAKRRRVFFVETFATIAIVTGSITYRVYTNIRHHHVDYDLTKVVHLFVEIVNKYITTITILLFYNFVLLVKDRFCLMNNKLNCDHRIRNYRQKLEIFSRCHYLLCEALEDINGNFGYVLFGIISFISLSLLTAVNIIINLLLNSSSHQHLSMIYVLFPYIYTCVVFVGLGIMIIASCEQVMKHAFKTNRICYDILLRYPSMDRFSSSETKIREILLSLAHHASRRRPNITAADFFSINSYVLGVILTTILSYLIIFIGMK